MQLGNMQTPSTTVAITVRHPSEMSRDEAKTHDIDEESVPVPSRHIAPSIQLSSMFGRSYPSPLPLQTLSSRNQPQPSQQGAIGLPPQIQSRGQMSREASAPAVVGGGIGATGAGGGGHGRGSVTADAPPASEAARPSRSRTIHYHSTPFLQNLMRKTSVNHG